MPVIAAGGKRDTIPAIKVVMVWWGRKASKARPTEVGWMGATEGKATAIRSIEIRTVSSAYWENYTGVGES